MFNCSLLKTFYFGQLFVFVKNRKMLIISNLRFCFG